MSTQLVTAVQYVTYAEAIGLYQALQEAEIMPLVQTCGPPRFPFMEGMYYKLLVNQEDLPAAQATLEQFSEKQALLTPLPQACSSCGSLDVGPKTGLRWWQKLFYAGTTVSQCYTCNASFFT